MDTPNAAASSSIVSPAWVPGHDLGRLAVVEHAAAGHGPEA